MCPLCLCGSFHPLALEKCILEYILPTKAGRADFSLSCQIHLVF
ncbi:Cell division trigger factor [Microcystis aeruginosa NIES-2481]|nr:Cell division trigger factor [Microcystis aeruginosa NIES-2481]